MMRMMAIASAAWLAWVVLASAGCTEESGAPHADRAPLDRAPAAEDSGPGREAQPPEGAPQLDHGLLPDKPSSPGAFGKPCALDGSSCDPAAPLCIAVEDQSGLGICTKTCGDPEDPKACYPTPPGGNLPVCAATLEGTSDHFCIFFCKLEQPSTQPKTWPCPSGLVCSKTGQLESGVTLYICEPAPS